MGISRVFDGLARELQSGALTLVETMADRTSYADTKTQNQVADRLRELADALESADTSVQVGNKSVQLSPPDSINYQIDVIERSSLLRGDHETVEIELGWKPERRGEGDDG